MLRILVIAVPALPGCGDSLQDAALGRQTPERRAAIEATLASPEALRGAFSDATRVTYSDRHGTQLEYHAPDGTAWLVYPGNRATLRGEWTTREGPSGAPQLCYRYPPDA